jgi:hypothetical protein
MPCNRRDFLPSSSKEIQNMINILQLIAERRINEAIQEGKINIDFESWRGKPLPLEDDGQIAPELRMAYKILKNAGFLPPEIETRKQIQQLEELIAASNDEHTTLKQMKKLNALTFKLNSMTRRPVNLEVNEEYYRKVVARTSLRSGQKKENKQG